MHKLIKKKQLLPKKLLLMILQLAILEQTKQVMLMMPRNAIGTQTHALLRSS